MLALRYVYILSLVVWLGGMAVLTTIVTPVTIGVLEMAAPSTGADLASAVVSATFARFHYVASTAGALLILTLTAMALLGPRPASLAVRIGIAAAMLAATLYSGSVVHGQIERLRNAAGGAPSRLAAGDLRRTELDGLQRVSTGLMLVTMAGALTLLYWEARESS